MLVRIPPEERETARMVGECCRCVVAAALRLCGTQQPTKHHAAMPYAQFMRKPLMCNLDKGNILIHE